VSKVSEAGRYPYGADISGFVRPDGFSPMFAVLCPECCRFPGWAEEAQAGEPLDEAGMDSLGDLGVCCEACGAPASEWRIEQGGESQ
jgi:hypothetical protein